MHPILSRLESDHHRMLKLLYTLNGEVGKFYGLHRGKASVDTILGILDYIQVYPEQWHHPIEDIIFDQLLQHPQADQAAITAVLQDHQRLESLSNRLAQIFGDLQMAHNTAGLSVIRLCKHFYTRQISHIHDERRLFADAQTILDADAWNAIETEVDRYLGEVAGERDAYLALLRRPTSYRPAVSGDHRS